MTLRAKVLISAVVVGSMLSLHAVWAYPAQAWTRFLFYLVAVLLCFGMKVALPKSDGTMSVNFPFILLGIIQLSPGQAVALAVASVVAQCRFRVVKAFTLVQIVFNAANVATATALAWFAYQGSLKLLHGEVAPALAIGATVYFLANTVPLAPILAWESGNPVHTHWWQEFAWYYPFYLIGAMLAAAANYLGNHFGWLTSMLLIPLVYTVYRAYRAQVVIIRDREQHIEEIEALHLRTIEGLAMAIEAKDRNTHGHLSRVRLYVSEIGKAMGLNAHQMKALITASFLHDIGKLAVPEYILNKPGKLTPDEFEKMKIHTVVGAEIVERVRFPYPVVPIVRSHHEAWDGSGYPDGLKGEEIPIGARILTAVDCFDALSSERPYRRALPVEQAMEMVKAKAGSQFDPAVIRIIEERYLQLEEMAHRQMDAMTPLNTDVVVERGAGPAAGFAVEKSGASTAAAGQTAETAAALSAGGATQETGRLPDFSVWIGSESNSGEPRRSEMRADLLRQLRKLIPFDCLAVYLKDQETIVAQYIEGRHAEAFSHTPMPIGEGLSGWVAQNHRPIVNGNPTVESNLRADNGFFTANSSAISIPLSDTSELRGVATLYSIGYAAFSTDHLRMLQAFPSSFFLSLINAPKADTQPVLEGSTR